MMTCLARAAKNAMPKLKPAMEFSPMFFLIETTAGGSEATSALKSPTLLSRTPILRSPSGAPFVSLEALIGRDRLGLPRKHLGGIKRMGAERETAKEAEAGAISALAWRG